MNVAHASTKTASVGIISTLSSSSCENGGTSIQWSCSIFVVKGSTIVVLLGCFGQAAGCANAQPKVGDSEADSYASIADVSVQCSSEGCRELAFWTTPTITGVNPITFTVSGNQFFAADIFDLTGVNSSVTPSWFGVGAAANFVPGAFTTGFKPITGGIALAGIVAAFPAKFLAGANYTLIPDQSCPQGCNSTLGDWQAAEFSNPASSSSSSAAFDYPSTNSGWQELDVSFAPVKASTTISCAAPFVAASSSKCTATVTGNAPNGTVSWSSNSTGTFSPSTCKVSSGQCGVLFTPSSTALVNVTSSYGGDPSNPATAGSVILKAAKATSQVGVNCAPSPVPTGSEAICTATVTGASPAGTITWASSGIANFSPGDTCTLSTGSCAVGYTPTGITSPISITALYSGDRNNVNGSGVFSLGVGAATTSTSSSTTSSTLSVASTASTSSLTTAVSTVASSTISASTSASSSSSITSVQSSSTGSSSSIGSSYIFVLAADVAVLAALGLLLRTRHRARPSIG
ncbi:MAG: hypothetical protein OK456_11410 [Thaumarchaeota archaeon]|nr:hypothetical protein [Nitrososphaerota archaeon]